MCNLVHVLKLMRIWGEYVITRDELDVIEEEELMEPVDELVIETVEAEVDRAYKNIKVLQVRLGI